MDEKAGGEQPISQETLVYNLFFKVRGRPKKNCSL
jgi:hypothetical protein